jgi:Xaa-Pro aminopeptidase
MNDVFARRREALARWLGENGLPALLVSHPANRFYLSGFELHDPQCNETAGYLVVTPEAEAFLLTDPRYRDVAQECVGPDNVCIYATERYKTMAGFLKSKGVTDLGFETRTFGYYTWKRLGEHVRLQAVDKAVERLRARKDEEELERLRESCRLNHQVFAEVERRLPDLAGLTERQAAWEVEKMFRDRGASELAFTPIIGVGPNGAKPHAELSDTVIRENDVLLVDMGGRYQHYCSDQTRTFWVGENPPDRFRETLDLVQEAQAKAIEKIQAGVPAADVHQTAFDVFKARGAEQRFLHGLGHGVGLETHEAPSLSSSSKDILQPGMVATVEPGLYDPQWAGLRWEHMVVVTDQGAEVL